MNSSLDIDAIEARADAAPEGPWVWGDVDDHHDPNRGWPLWADDGDLLAYLDPPGSHYLGGEAAEFIAHARTDIPALIARIRELEADAARAADPH